MKTNLRLRLETKEITPQGTFEGRLSPYGEVDSYGDVVDQGAYVKTLKDQGNTRMILWQHRGGEPIGSMTLEDRADGLWCKGTLELEDPIAKRAYFWIKKGIISGLSIGFESVKDVVENGIRHLKEIKLFEGSIVTFPAADSARIISVRGKRETRDDFNEELSDIQLYQGHSNMMWAVDSALCSIIWDSEMTAAEKVSAATEYIQQFADAYLAYLPAFLAVLAEDYGGMEMMAAKRKLEVKAGAEFSAANKQTIQTRLANIKSEADAVLALFEDKAGPKTTSKEAGADTTLESKAADQKPEPIEDHSAIELTPEQKGHVRIFVKEIFQNGSSKPVNA